MKNKHMKIVPEVVKLHRKWKKEGQPHPVSSAVWHCLRWHCLREHGEAAMITDQEYEAMIDATLAVLCPVSQRKY